MILLTFLIYYVITRAGAGNVALSPNQTFCLPVQKVAGISGGKVAAGGFSFRDHSGTPIDTLWTVYNGSSSRTLHVIGGSTTSYFHEVDTVPVGSFYQACITDSTSFNITGQIQQTEYNVS